MNKEKIVDGKKLLVTGALIGSFLPMVGCCGLDKLASRSTHSTSNSEPIESTETITETTTETNFSSSSVTPTEETTIETTARPTGYQDIMDGKAPNEKHTNENSLSRDEFEKIYDAINHNGYDMLNFGTNNSISEKYLREYTGDNEISVYNYNFFHNSCIKYCREEFHDFEEKGFSSWNKTNKKLQMNVARYILAENGKTFLVDEIPGTYFEEKFPEYMYMLDNMGYEEAGLFDTAICDQVNSVESLEELATIDAKTDNFDETLYYEFLSCYFYNKRVRSLAATYKKDEDIKEVPFYDEETGKIVKKLAITPEQDKKICEEINKISGMHMNSVYDGETTEQVLASIAEQGYDVSQFESIFNAMDGAKTEKCKNSRARTS